MDKLFTFLKGNSFSLIISLGAILFFLLSFNSIFGFTKNKIPLSTALIRNDINAGPVIAEFKNVFTSKECDEISESGKRKVEPSLVGFNFGKDESRTSSHTWLAREDYPAIMRVSKLVSELTNLPMENQEKFQLVRYQKGQKYNHHLDSCNPQAGDYKHCIENAKNHGARKFTFLIYLNDVFHGGETDFPKVGIKIQPRKGCAVLFKNLLPYSRQSDPESLHAGLPPTHDVEKWIINVWVRDTYYDLYNF